MLFRYVLSYHAPDYDHVELRAFYRTKFDPDTEELELVIGDLRGERALLLRKMIDDAAKMFGSVEDDGMMVIGFPEEERAASLAYRIGLCTLSLNHAPGRAACDRLLTYIVEASDDEIAFWTRKSMDNDVGPERTTAAMCIVSRSMNVRPVDH